ncbi:GNAT family N-acetyltransferase [Amycolatopsis nalaikhensis]|uniref:GNAT family N-acetyltransferase n=1 Tax=Amycolatopsis nalaikhensis TaxID=715472 RepID=A0ABY8XR44_9PSEU|nr:GNAT family N-acetyltransferase [Amycolatopsis sp. 2-2]WIV57986.1 GNAT family N-acetyltransferase [Amycolatopsis sp. 2-2]
MASRDEGEDDHVEVVLPPRKLERRDNANAQNFQSGADELDDWLAKFAWANQKANNAVTYVSVTNKGRVVGYYAIVVAGVSKQNVPGQVSGKNPPTDVSCILLARLAVDWEYQGRGIGQALFADAMKKTFQLSRVVGVRAMLIHARDEQARDFYLKHADLVQSPTDPLHLMISMHVIEAALDEAGIVVPDGSPPEAAQDDEDNIDDDDEGDAAVGPLKSA